MSTVPSGPGDNAPQHRGRGQRQSGDHAVGGRRRQRHRLLHRAQPQHGRRQGQPGRQRGSAEAGLLPAPRTALAYMLVCALEVAALAGVAPRIHTEIDAAAAFLAEQLADLQALAAEVAGRIGDAAPVVLGADLTAPVARRWKTQINENADAQAFFSELPEADHNEICAWSGDGFAAVLLEDSDQHPRERRRFELTAEAIGAAGAEAIRLETRGETRVARLLWATILGDLVSLELAEARGVDPLPVTAIDALKGALGRP